MHAENAKCVVRSYSLNFKRTKKRVPTATTTMVVNQSEVGVGDFVLLDKIDIENFMRNLELRWVGA